MIAPRSVIVPIRNAAACRAAMEAGIELARLFRAPVHGLFVKDQSLEELCELPAVFLPATLRGAAPGLHRRAMEAALMHEIRRVREELERFATRARVQARVTVGSGHPGGAIAGAARSEDLVVTSIDLSRRPLAPTVEAAVRLCPASGGVLLVPERALGRTGAVAALVSGPDDRAVAVAAQIAAGLRAPLCYAVRDLGAGTRRAIRDRVSGIAGAGQEVRFIELSPGGPLDAVDTGAEPVRLVVVSIEDAGSVDLDGPYALIRRYRAPMLVLD